MQFSTTTIIAASAFFSTITVASPLVVKAVTHNATTTIDRTDSPMYFEKGKGGLTPDDVIHLLQSSGKITWKPHGPGHYVDISEEIWYGAINNATKKAGTKPVPRGLEARDTIGDVGSYAASAACYGSGSVMTDTGIAGFVTDACDALVGNSVPPLVLKSLRVWQSGQLADSNGIASYVRFSAKLLTDGFHYDTTLCGEALASFNNWCQKDSGDTRGGEIEVGKAINFNADPTEFNCNC